MHAPIFVSKHEKDSFVTAHDTVRIIDTFEAQCEELFEVLHPEHLFSADKLARYTAWRSSYTSSGVWVYYPWHNTLVHLLSQDDFLHVRTSRNKPFITPEEQKRFKNITVGFAGLNVGNPGAVCTTLEGGSYHMKFADFDTLSLANLNRFRSGVCSLGENKVTLSAQQVWDIDPFYTIDIYSEGITDTNIDTFLLEPKIDVLIEETDNLALKIRLRERAKQYGIPVIMVTGNEAGNIVDVERYDTDPGLPILNDLLPQHVRAAVETPPPKGPALLKLLRDFMGSVHTPRLRDSFARVGIDIAGIPQLAEASFLRGACITHAIRRIVVHDSLPSGRYAVDLDGTIR